MTAILLDQEKIKRWGVGQVADYYFRDLIGVKTSALVIVLAMSVSKTNGRTLNLRVEGHL